MSQKSPVTPAIADEIRRISLKELEKNPRVGWRAVARKMSEHFPELNPATLVNYCIAFGGATDYTYSLYRDGSISYSTLQKVMAGKMGRNAKDLIAKKVFQYGFGPSNIRNIKKALEKGMALEVAIQIEAGNTSKEELKASIRSQKSVSAFERLSDDLILDMSKLITKLTVLEDMIPRTSLNKDSVKSDFVRALWFYCDAVSRTNEFLKSKVKRFFEENREFAVTEYLLGNGESRKEEKHA